MTPKITRRPAVEADLDFLVALRRATMREHFERTGQSYDEDKQRQRVQYQFDCGEIIVVDGEAIGLLKVDKSTAPWHFIQLQLVPAWQGRGLGGQLIAELLATAAEQGAEVELTVLKGSPAQRLYERLGFRLVAERPHSRVMRWSPSSA